MTTSTMLMIHINMYVWVALVVLWSAVLVATQSSPITFYTDEEQRAGTLVGNVKTASNISQEVEEGQLDLLQFHILSSDGLRITSIFSINSKTGAIYTNAMIDREQICKLDLVCKLEFDVTVKTNVSFVKLLTIAVIIVDINDNAPTFPKREITLTIPESAPLYSEIPISGAFDWDAGLDSNISYSLQMSSVFNLTEVRQLDGSSALKLVVQKALDREAVPAYSFLILASDGSGPTALTGTLTVSVQVSDVNDNAPKFTKDTFDMTVMETAPVGTVFGHLTATDGDVGDNGKLSFRFSQLTTSEVTDLFVLNSTTGELSVAAALQYESGRSFQCVVEVMDLGVPPEVSQAILRIEVKDAGNTPPKMDLVLAEPVFGDQSAMLSEDVQLGTFVGTLKVEDLDVGLEGQVICSSLDRHFSLQDLDINRYGIVVNQSLDRETQQEMIIVLFCRDSGEPPLNSSTSFKVIVRDVNDNAPVFIQTIFYGSVTENGGGEQYVTRVIATDADDSTNNVITYSLSPTTSPYFSIDPTSGRITTTATYDRERTPFLALTVYGVDSGSPSLTGSASVSVKISDVNDHAPYVNRSDYYISENLSVGEMFNISVVDDDEGENGTVVVTMQHGHSTGIIPFTIMSNGSIRVQAKLDREKKASYVIPLNLRDQGTPSLSSTATLTIQLVDNNDHVPLFIFPTPNNNSVVVRSHSPVGSHVCQIQAVDSDMGRNGDVTYTISTGNSGEWLGINNQTGEVFLIRDVTDLAGSTLHLTVSASDRGSPPLVSRAFLDVVVRTSGSGFPPGQGGDEGDQYVIIVGIIAGITFIIAVIVIAVIVHMRYSDNRRSRGERNKGAGKREGDHRQKLSVLSQKEIVLTDSSSKSTSGVPPVQGSTFGQVVDNGGFDSLGLTSVARDPKEVGSIALKAEESSYDPAFAAFVEGRNRLVSEDHNSDTSGETTTCDSGRGASDEEIAFPLSTKTPGSSEQAPPRIPPRQPLSATSHWSHDAHVLSTNWSGLADVNHYVTEEAAEGDSEVDEPSLLRDDFRNKSRKGPLRVHFSFDEGDSRSQNSVLSHHGSEKAGYTNQHNGPNLTSTLSSFDPKSQPYIPLHADAQRASPFSQSAPQHFTTGDRFGPKAGFSFSRQNNSSYRPYPQDARLGPEGMYPRVDRFPRKQNSHQVHPGWDRQHGRTLDSVSSMGQSVDDDVSTTTSGSYSIDVDDVLNGSLEC